MIFKDESGIMTWLCGDLTKFVMGYTADLCPMACLRHSCESLLHAFHSVLASTLPPPHVQKTVTVIAAEINNVFAKTMVSIGRTLVKAVSMAGLAVGLKLCISIAYSNP